ncbi:MAG: hypothetical protein C0626_00075 [Arcobacter sp.]|uniref:YdcH family protein n=1 Tax=uncultured Arcobacter sp. TaxID=165434 RepID=UPI000CB4213C|nr:DUF465 domain-containing protein [uncultured Arcobacter sp.]PLY11009.1 MAG: hypothetical protein C0626_00075 [Arcobacter sp.]
MFHEHREIITQLKSRDNHFHNLFDKHNALDEEIAQLEKAHADQFEIETKKKEKLRLKDEIYDVVIKYKKDNNL